MSGPKKMKCLKVEMVGRGEVLVDMDPPLTKDKDKDKCADGRQGRCTYRDVWLFLESLIRVGLISLLAHCGALHLTLPDLPSHSL